VKKFYDSAKFKEAAKASEPFFKIAHDFVFGDRPLILENAVSAPSSGLGPAR
jgi:hypothetical protein